MKNFNFNLLQYLNNKKAEKGFTLIELLVVIIIIGILSAIALPAFLNQAAKARQSEAKQGLGAMNRGQQAYYLEQQQFAPTISSLGLGLPSFSSNYIYGGAFKADWTATTAPKSEPATAPTTGGTGQAQFALGTTAPLTATIYASPVSPNDVRGYGAVAYVSADQSGNATTATFLCEGTKPPAQTGAVNPAPTATGCGGSKQL